MNKSNTTSKEYLLAEIDDLADEFSEVDENGLHSERWCGIMDAKQIIINAPSVSDRPQGEWIEVRAFDAFGGDEAAWMAHGNPIAFHYCSECKEQSRLDEFGEEMLSNYCPSCGARMKGADDETEIS